MGNIITFDDLETEGIDAATYNRARAEALILDAEDVIEKITGRLFRKVDTSVYASGRDRDILLLPHPPIAITTVSEVDNSTSVEVLTEIPSTAYAQESDLLTEVALRNPKLKRFDAYWSKGDRNYKVTGSFGFVFAMGTTPETYSAPRMIKRAAVLIVAKYLPKTVDRVGTIGAGRIIQESLKGYSYTLSEAAASGHFNDPEIDGILMGYRRLGIASV
ncbi:hypothetical protein M0R72_07895 [Candidatus Pacearchaeota archaeon]|jgi:hypothetical protein|nr:hypothetical protein [Candidatus Pacearchaeota archaeon]